MQILRSNQLSLSQLFFFLIQAQIGLSILSLPSDLGKIANHDGWISIILATIAVQIMAFFYYYLMKQYPDKTFYEVTETVFGPIIGKSLNYIMIFYYFVYSAHFAFQCTSILKIWNYYKTPFWVILLLLIFLGFYIVNGDLLPIGRFLTLASVIVLIMIYFLFWDLPDLNYRFLLPIGEAKTSDIIEASKMGIVAFAGFEIFLFIHPFVQSSAKKKLRIVNISIWSVSFLYLLTTIFVYMYFPNASKNIQDPVIYFIIPMHFTVIERIEVFFIAFWTILMITSHICFLYMGLLGLSRTRKKEHHNHYAKQTSIIIFVVSIVAHMYTNDQIIRVFKNYLMYYTFVIIFVIPITTVIVHLFLKKKQKGVAKSEK